MKSLVEKTKTEDISEILKHEARKKQLCKANIF